MEQGNTISVRKISEWNRLLNVNAKDIFNDLASIGVSLATQNYWDVGKASLSVFTGGLSKRNDKPEHRAYLLLYGAIRQSLVRLIMESGRILREGIKIKYEATAFQKLVDRIDLSFESEEISIDEDFFARPEQHRIFQLVKPLVLTWLEGLGLKKVVAKQICNRWDYLYVCMIDTLLSDESEYFQTLKAKTDRSPSQKRLWARHLYNESLIAQWSAPVFDEPFGLQDIFIQLNACFPIDEKEKSTFRRRYRVVDAEKHIWDWLQDSQPAFRSMILHGGPGSGKSSLMKRIVRRLAEEDDRKFYLIPLQFFKFPSGVAGGIKDWIGNQKFLEGKEDPMDPSLLGTACKTVFIFDGLDELSRTGNSGKAVAQEFMTRLGEFLSEVNARKEDWDFRAIVTGRDLVVQETSEGAYVEMGRKIELLPYQVDQNSDDWKNYDFSEGQKLLSTDLRSRWWKQFWKAKGERKTDIPEELSAEGYESLTCQPLLSYLLARAYCRGQLDNTTRENINIVYERLIEDVRRREWGGEEGFKHAKIEAQDFKRLLEELAVAAWHGGDVRATTMAAFEQRCTAKELQKLLKNLSGTGESHPSDLMVSFFSRKVGTDHEGEALIEFTHKSFGEYLVASRIVSLVEYIDEASKSTFYPEDQALKDWLALVSREAMTEYIWEFLEREVKLKFHVRSEAAARLQSNLSALFSRCINEGFDLKLLDEKMSLGVLKAEQNAQSSLLLTIAAFAKVSGKRSMIEWRGPDHPKMVLSKLMSWGSELILQGLYGLQFAFRSDLTNMNFREADLEFSSLIGANLERSDLSKANLSGADLSNANLTRAFLIDAKLTGANLRYANLRDVVAHSVDFRYSEMYKAKLQGLDLYYFNWVVNTTILSDVRLDEADTVNADEEDVVVADEADLEAFFVDNETSTDETIDSDDFTTKYGDPLEWDMSFSFSFWGFGETKIFPIKINGKLLEDWQTYQYFIDRGAINVPKPDEME